MLRQEGDPGGSVQEGLLQSFKRKSVLETALSSVLHLISAYLKKCSASSLQIFMQWSGGGFTGDFGSSWSGMPMLCFNL